MPSAGTGAGSPTISQFLQAEKAQESSGNYSAVSPAGALGAWQIMPANIGPWSQQFLGRTISSQEFLANAGEQDAIAYGELTQLYNNYGPRGAAAAWYSGNPNLANDTTPQANGPSISQYVDQVMAKALAAPDNTHYDQGGSSSSGPSIQTASLSWNPLDWPWARIGLGLLGGLLVIVGLWVTFADELPAPSTVAKAGALALA